MTSRAKGSGSARAARSSLAEAASSRKRGSGWSGMGRSPVKISGRDRRVGIVPFGYPVEEAPQRREVPADGVAV